MLAGSLTRQVAKIRSWWKALRHSSRTGSEAAAELELTLGAQRRHVLWIVAHNVSLTVGCGLVAELAVILAFQKLLTQWIGNNAHDPLILAAVALLFLLSAAAACIVPALRAASIDPVTALRYE